MLNGNDLFGLATGKYDSPKEAPAPIIVTTAMRETGMALLNIGIMAEMDTVLVYTCTELYVDLFRITFSPETSRRAEVVMRRIMALREAEYPFTILPE